MTEAAESNLRDAGSAAEVTPGEGPDLLDDLQRLIAALESNPDPAVRAQVAALLQGIDAIHRTALTHLVNAIMGMAGQPFLDRLTGDPAIRLLLMSYGLLAVDRRLVAEEALDAVRGHLHGHGVDVELTEVVGGAVYVKLHGLEASGIQLEPVRRDIEEALKTTLLGFQELVLGDRQTASGGMTAGLILPTAIGRARKPVYRRAVSADEVPPGSVKGVDLAGNPVLVANVEGDFYAVSNRCGESPLPLEFSRLEGPELRCSWHGCRYDVRSGARVDGGPERLAVFPVTVEEGEVKVAVGTQPQ